MTHINAYFQDVEDAKKAVVLAEAELATSELALKAKKLEDGVVDEPVDEPKEAPKKSSGKK